MDMIGKVLGNYRITEQVGSGGMGIVYLAEHVLLGKSAAVKVLKPERCESPEIVERFFNEARAAAMVKDPGIPEIFDYGLLDEGNAYLVMEMLEGQTLGELLKDCFRLSPGRSLALARLLAGTLKATHKQGIIHRDLKPDNIYIVPDPAMPRGERIKVLDFGIAKLQGTNLASGIQTETGRLMGTPYYMSPEQCRGAGTIDHRTDIYSLGCVLYQMLCGEPPFVLEGSGEVLAAHIHLEPKPVHEVEASVPVELSNLTMQLLKKDPDTRLQTMQAVMERLNEIASYSEMLTPEPSLAASADMAIERYRDTIDDMPPLKAVTTLQASSGEFETASPNATWALHQKRPSMLNRMVLPMLILFSAGGLIAWSVLNRQVKHEDQPVQAALSPPPTQPASPAPQPIIVRELVEIPAALVELRIESDPSGARVYRLSDGVEVGRTPVTISARQGSGSAGFLLRKTGYRNAKVEMAVANDGATQVVLKARSRNPNKTATEPTTEVDFEPETTPLEPETTPNASEFGGDGAEK